jgi:hypothetical protein
MLESVNGIEARWYEVRDRVKGNAGMSSGDNPRVVLQSTKLMQ